MYVPLLGKSLKGTVLGIVADNLGAHGIARFIESFSGDYVCRFCTAKSSEFRNHCVASGAFSLRTREGHADHVKRIHIALELRKSAFLPKLFLIFMLSPGFHLMLLMIYLKVLCLLSWPTAWHH